MTSHTASASYEISTPKTGGGNPFTRAASGIATFFGDLARASEAAATYQRLSNLSDSALAKRGLKREDLARHVFATVFAK